MALIKSLIHKFEIANELHKAGYYDKIPDIQPNKKEGTGIMEVLLVLDKNSIIIKDKDIRFRDKPSSIKCYEYNENVYNILTEVYKNKVIAKACITDIPNLDIDDYKSVKHFYDIATTNGVKISSDKELVDYVLYKMIPSIKAIKHNIKLGKSAFSGSSARQYNLSCLLIYDISILQSISLL